MIGQVHDGDIIFVFQGLSYLLPAFRKSSSTYFVFSMTRSPSNPSLFQNSAPKYKSDAISQAQIEVSQSQHCAEPICKLLKQTDIQPVLEEGCDLNKTSLQNTSWLWPVSAGFYETRHALQLVNTAF